MSSEEVKGTFFNNKHVSNNLKPKKMKTCYFFQNFLRFHNSVRI